MDINNCTTSNTALSQESATISHNGNLTKRFSVLISNLESVDNHTNKPNIKDFIHFSKDNLENINASLMSVGNPQEVTGLMREVAGPCLVALDDIKFHDGNTPYIIQDEGKFDDSLKSLKDWLQRDIDIQNNKEAPLSTEDKLIREAKRLAEQAERETKRIADQAQDKIKYINRKFKKF